MVVALLANSGLIYWTISSSAKERQTLLNAIMAETPQQFVTMESVAKKPRTPKDKDPHVPLAPYGL